MKATLIVLSSILGAKFENRIEDRKVPICKINVLNNNINVTKDVNFGILGFVS